MFTIKLVKKGLPELRIYQNDVVSDIVLNDSEVSFRIGRKTYSMLTTKQPWVWRLPESRKQLKVSEPKLSQFHLERVHELNCCHLLTGGYPVELKGESLDLNCETQLEVYERIAQALTGGANIPIFRLDQLETTLTEPAIIIAYCDGYSHRALTNVFETTETFRRRYRKIRVKCVMTVDPLTQGWQPHTDYVKLAYSGAKLWSTL